MAERPRLIKMARRFQRRQTSLKRRTLWGPGLGSGQTRSLAVSTAIIHAFVDFRLADNTALIGGTIGRIRGQFTCIPASFTADNEAFGAIGVGIVSGEAFDAGVGSVPTPITEGGDRIWMYHSMFATLSRATASPGNNNIVASSIVIDNKSMRKIGPNDVLIWVVQSGAGLGTARMYWDQRHLFLLP